MSAPGAAPGSAPPPVASIPTSHSPRTANAPSESRPAARPRKGSSCCVQEIAEPPECKEHHGEERGDPEAPRFEAAKGDDGAEEPEEPERRHEVEDREEVVNAVAHVDEIQDVLHGELGAEPGFGVLSPSRLAAAE